MEQPLFFFLTSQVGVEPILKRLLQQDAPFARLAYSRPGCMTFKIMPAEQNRFVEALQRNPFVRTFGVTLQRLTGTDGQELGESVRRLFQGVRLDALHVWQRDISSTPAEQGDLAITPLSTGLGETILQHWATDRPRLNQRARKGQVVGDVLLVEPTEWLIGHHQVLSEASGWPGGMPLLEESEEPISRAYWKTKEALRWSRMPIRAGDRIVEIGSAPGGSAQALLELGLHVIGVDPAEMDQSLIADSAFEHWRMRGGEIKRRALRGIRWLTVDVNVLPHVTLKMLEELVVHPSVKLDGMLITLKMPDWELAEQLSRYLAQIRSWNFRYVKARHLFHNRKELCVFALRQKALLRVGKPLRRKRGSEEKQERNAD